MSTDPKKRTEDLTPRNPETTPARPPADAQVLCHELQLQRVELEALRNALNQAEEDTRMLTALMENVPEGIILVDAEGNLRQMSRVGRKLLEPHNGTSISALADQWEVYATDGQTPVGKKDLPLVRAMRDGTPIHNVELVQIDANGEKVPLLCNAAPIRDSNGTVTGGIVAWRDITEHKRIESALRASEQQLAQLNLELELRVEKRTAELQESEEKYRLVFESESDAIMIFDGQTRQFIDINSAAEKLYGYPRQDFLKLTHYAITAVPEVSDEKIRKTLMGHPPSQLISRHRKKDGTVFSVQITACTFSWKGRAVICGVIRDITEQVQREEDLLNSQRELRRLASELSLAEQHERQRIATSLHDGLCQLLISSHLRLDALRSAPLPEKAALEIGILCDIIKQAAQETRELTFELSCPLLNELGLSAAVEELCADLSQEQAVRFEFSGDAQRLPMPSDSRLVLYRATRELLINVIKHAETNRARVDLQQDGQTVCIRVSDDGLGFDSSSAGNGFSPSGGFGLFNIREELRHIGGKLKIDAIPGGGTRVEMTAPLGSPL
jgi:PAS domain S-box-containing protein